MNNKGLSKKRIAIDKDQAMTVATIAISASIIVFCLVAARVLISKMGHQGDVIAEKEKARDQLIENLEELNTLKNSYVVFDGAPESILGNPNEANSRVVLDALPSKYDFAAVLSSIEKILQNGTYEVNRLEGIDQELDAEQEAVDPQPVEIPITINVNTNYEGAQQLVVDLNRSIRPMNIRAIALSGEDDDLQLEIELITYYQPENILDINTKVVR